MGKLTLIYAYVENDSHLTAGDLTLLSSILAQFDAFETWLYFWSTFPVIQQPGDPPLPPAEQRITSLFWLNYYSTTRADFISEVDSACVNSSYNLNHPPEYSNLLIAAGDFYDMFN